MLPGTLCDQWLQFTDDAITVESVTNVLGKIPEDPWVVAAVADRCVDNVDVQRVLLNLGLERTRSTLERSREAMPSASAPVDAEEGAPGKSHSEPQLKSLVSHFSVHSTDELVCRLRTLLLARLDKLETYVEILQKRSKEIVAAEEDLEDRWDDLDPWDDAKDPNIDGAATHGSLDLSLSDFLRESLVHAALNFASNMEFDALSILFDRHADSLNPHRLYILQNIPEHSHPASFRSLLPAIEFSTGTAIVPKGNPWRKCPDWTEEVEVRSAFQTQESSQPPSSVVPTVHTVSKWYHDRTRRTDELGLVDVALALVQHGASQGVPDLDELGEELGLFSRLIYDAPGSNTDTTYDYWSLSRWKSLEPMDVIHAYLSDATPESIAGDIRRLVMPYLFVLESREERAGRGVSDLATQLFYDYLFQAPLELLAAIFEASKPILSSSERLIKKDEDMARLALSCLYGSNSLSDWHVMSQLFECLPEWSEIEKEEINGMDMTLMSLGEFVTPSMARSRCTPKELFVFFSPLPVPALSRALDVLDVHLESGEILAKWNVPAPLRWFLQSANDEGQQRAWATRMSRSVGSGGGPEDDDDWLELLEDMLKLADGGEGALKGAFGLLGAEELIRIFFSGMLSSGEFAVAKEVLQKSSNPYLSDTKMVENQVIISSREFYDNSSSGNLHQGNMKLAYECLTVAKPSEAIQREREFIEATSRICSFNVVSRPGIPITPIEIRLAKDRLDLIARVLSSTEDAYKHSRVILDLVNRLGYRGDDTAEVKALAMLSDAALQSEDFLNAAEFCERMIRVVQKLRESSLLSTSTSDNAGKRSEAVDVCWRSCFQLGRQSEFHDTVKKLNLLGRTLEICPPEHIPDVLNVWRKVEDEDMEIRTASRRQEVLPKPQTGLSIAALSRARLGDLNSGSPALPAPDAAAAAALASRTLKSVAANFPFHVRGRQAETKPGDSGDESLAPDVSAHAKQALARGIGWLIGADDQM